MRLHARRWFWTPLLMAFGAGCCSPSGGDAQPDPPVLTQITTGAEGKRVGDTAEVRWHADQPVNWEAIALPKGWKFESSSDTDARMFGRFEMGSSQVTDAATVKARGKSSGAESNSTVDVKAALRVVDPAPFKTASDLGITRAYLVDVTATVPPWSDSSRGAIRVVADTEGLSNPGNGPVPDSIEVGDEEVATIEWKSTASGQCTQAGTIEGEERFFLTGDKARQMVANGVFKITLADHSPQNNCSKKGALTHVAVTFE